jgi:hypothetical protein
MFVHNNGQTSDVSDEPERGGGLLLGGIQLSIMLGGALGVVREHARGGYAVVSGPDRL